MCIDGSNETGLEKNESNNSVNLRFEIGKTVNLFLDMCETTSATVEAIYTTLNEKISQLLYTCKPWHNSTYFGVDNISLNTDILNSLKTRIIVDIDSTYFSGCPFHIIHNPAQKVGEAFSCNSNFAKRCHYQSVLLV